MRAAFYTRPVAHRSPPLVSRFQRKLTDEELMAANRPVSRLVADSTGAERADRISLPYCDG